MTYKQINIWFQNRRDRDRGCSDLYIDRTTTVKQLEHHIRSLLGYPPLQHFTESDCNSLEVTSSGQEETTRLTPQATSLSSHAHLLTAKGENLNQTIESNVFSFPKPNWLRKPSSRAATSEKKFPVALDGLVSRFDSCRVDGSSKIIPAQEPPLQSVTEEQTKSSNPFAGRILKNLPRRRLPKHPPVSQDTCDSSRKIRPLPRRTSPSTDSSVEPSDEESFTSLLSSNMMSSSNESLQDPTSRTLTNPQSPIEKVLSWRNKNSTFTFNL
ncbi:hypothetical protein Clacol_003936 [Clathrus columnatus]|uniref:Homeobox domain-containing protein n=1 Tax=Clathrus columnatus TaxID=1419009 RepID=A0AAV5A7U1_9AGAM|nr:hypothetical protein Clacol_003936 [Clathrus columnatus]